MDCKEFQEYISPLVDDQIDDLKRNEAENHLSNCISCCFDFKIEKITKNIVNSRFQKSTCPEFLKNQIILNLVSQRSFFEQAINYIKDLLNKKYFRISFALSVLVLAFLLVFNPFEDQKEKYYQEFASIIYQNCKELRNHKFPEKTIISSNPEVVLKFISANGISNPKMPRTGWMIVAAGIESYNDYNAAHLLFKCEQDTIYMMECELEKVYKSGYLSFVKKIHKDLEQQKFVKVDHEGCSIIFRVENGVLMAFAMSSDNRDSYEELIASLD